MNKILDCFESWVEISADKIAVSDEYKTLTYRELHIYSVQLAGALSDSGVVDGDIISVQLERSVEVLVVLLALLRIGCVYVPLDSSLPNEKIRAIKSQFSCKFTIDNHFISRFYERLKNFDRSALPLTQQKSAKSGSAYLLFTSGTTGKPKGVEISRSGLENIIQGLQSTLRENEDSSYAMLSSISFDISLHQLLIPVICGGSLHIFTQKECLDLSALYDSVALRGINSVCTVPSFLRALILSNKEKKPLKLSKIMLAGEKFPKALLQETYAHLGNCEVFNLYGPTEASIYATVYRCNSHDLHESNAIISLGKSLPGYDIRIVDENMRPVDPGEKGEILIIGIGVANGYLNNLPLTALSFSCFHSHGFDEGKRSYLTGDLGYLDSIGNLHYLGRRDSQIKVNGIRVEIGEIETQIARISGIQDCTVWQESIEDHLTLYCAYVSINPIETTSLREQGKLFLQATLVPTRFFHFPSFPLNANGKACKNRIKEFCSSKTFSSFAGMVQSQVNQETSTILEFLRKELHLVNIKANDLLNQAGLDSLGFAVLYAWLDQRFPGKISPNELRLSQNVADLSQLIKVKSQESFESPQSAFPNWVSNDVIDNLLRIDRMEVLKNNLHKELEVDALVRKYVSRNHREILKTEIHLRQFSTKESIVESFGAMFRSQELMRAGFNADTCSFRVWEASLVSIPEIKLDVFRDKVAIHYAKERLTERLRLVPRSPETLLWDSLLIRWNDGTFSVIVVFDHIIGDRSMEEVISTWFQAQLLDKGMLSQPTVPSYSRFLEKLSHEQQLRSFSESEESLSWSEFKETANKVSFQLSPSEFGHYRPCVFEIKPPIEEVIDAAFCLKALQLLLCGAIRMSKFPVRLLDVRRIYGAENFGLTVGDFHDCLPILVNQEDSCTTLRIKLQSMRETCSKMSLHFATLGQLNPSISESLYRSSIRLNFLGAIDQEQESLVLAEMLAPLPHVNFPVFAYHVKPGILTIGLPNGFPVSAEESVLTMFESQSVSASIRR